MQDLNILMRADYIIIGSGSAGSALAYRLSADGKHSVLVLEYGGSDASPLIQAPGALSYPMNMRRYDWGYQSEPEPGLGNRRMATPRGKVIGGSSSINGMVYVRGHAEDFNEWERLGAHGWGYDDVLPYFKRMENWHDCGHGGDQAWRGDSGPLHVGRGQRRNPLFHAFVRAGSQAGYPLTDDYNGEHQEGFGPMEHSIWRGRRWSTANAYLKPALRRSNCNLLRCFARKLLINQRRVSGVEIERRGQIMTVHAEREVILAAGSINSPKLLLLSGIGPAAQLAEHGIELQVDRPGVGQNLQDHLEVYIQQACLEPITLYRYWNFWGKAYAGLRWLYNKSGPAASNQFESAGFIRSSPDASYPDIQFHFLPLAVRYDGQVAAAGHGYQAHVGHMRSAARGSVSLRSADPHAHPRIVFNYMSGADDWANFRRAIRITRTVFAQEALSRYRGLEIQPGEEVQSDAELDDFIRYHAESAYHPCGSARMGAADDPLAVVDPECRVIGVTGLRLADSSVFPQITYGNINAPTIMVGEKAADHILEASRAPPL